MIARATIAVMVFAFQTLRANR